MKDALEIVWGVIADHGVLLGLIGLGFSTAAFILGLVVERRGRHQLLLKKTANIDFDLKSAEAAAKILGELGSKKMDPNLIVSGIAAVLQAMQTWMQYKDSGRAAGAFANVFQGGANPALQAAAQQLAGLAPPDVVDAFGNRIKTCWTNYSKMLNAPPGSFMPNELDDATEAVKRCVCRELGRLQSVNGPFPPGQFADWWQKYKCV